MGEANCIYIDAERKWWTAEIKDDLVLGEENIILIEEKTEEFTNSFIDEFVEFVNSIAPHILFVDEDNKWYGTSPKERNIVYQN